MWYLFYNVALAAVFFAALPMLPLIFLLGTRYREGLAQRLGFYPKKVHRSLASARPIWIHAASVGEVRSAEALVGELKSRAPDRKVLLSTFTVTGNRVARQIPGVDGVIYLPLDFSWTVRRALRAFDPSLLLIIETEIWPNLLRGAFLRGIPSVLLSGRLSEKAFLRYSLFRAFFRHVLSFFSVLGMQSRADAARIAKLGAQEQNVCVVGSLKFAASFTGNGWQKIVSARDPARPLIVAGSSHAGEEEILLAAFKSARVRFPRLSLVLAPRHPERFDEVERLLLKRSFAFERRSRVAAEQFFMQDILLLDTIGELAEFFAAGDIAFVGGSLVDVGGHNLLEPARFQKPILFGPHMANFKSIAEEMKRSGAAIEVRDADDLARACIELLADSEARARMGERAYQIAGADRSALMLNIKLAERYL